MRVNYFFVVLRASDIKRRRVEGIIQLTKVPPVLFLTKEWGAAGIAVSR